MSESKRVLTMREVEQLADVVTAVRRSRRVAWTLNGSGDVITGTARSVGDERGNFAGPDDDVRDCWMRITTDIGMEVFMPVSEVLDRVADMEMSLDYS